MKKTYDIQITSPNGMRGFKEASIKRYLIDCLGVYEDEASEIANLWYNDLKYTRLLEKEVIKLNTKIEKMKEKNNAKTTNRKTK